MRKLILIAARSKSWLLTALFSCCLLAASSQNLQFYSPFDSLSSGNNYFLVGQLGQNNLLLYTTPWNQTGLLICDTNGRAVNKKILPLPAPVSHGSVIASADHFDIVFQQRVDNMNYAQVARFDKEGQVVLPPKIVDSSRLDLLGPAAYYMVGSSDNNRFTLLYRLLQGLQKDQLLVSYLLLDHNMAILDTRNFYIPFNSDLDTASHPYIDATGAVMIVTHDKASSYKLGSNVMVYRMEPGKDVKKGSLYLKENKPLAFSFITTQKGELFLGALSHNFYKKEISGVLAVKYNVEKSKPDTSLYFVLPENFGKGFARQISGINARNLKRKLHLAYFDVDENNNFSFAVGLVSQKKNGNGFSRAEGHGSGFTITSSTPSQSMDGIRNYAAAIALPANTRGYTPEMNAYIQKMVRLQDMGVNAPPAAPASPSVERMYKNTLDAANEMKMMLTADASMVYRTYFFAVSPGKQPAAGDWEEHVHFSRAPILTSAIVKLGHRLGMLHYTERKNERLLAFQPLKEDTDPSIMGKPADPTLFYGRRYTITRNKTLLTLYVDQNLRLGLASLTLEH